MHEMEGPFHEAGIVIFIGPAAAPIGVAYWLVLARDA
jgi:hypothetical protein